MTLIIQPHPQHSTMQKQRLRYPPLFAMLAALSGMAAPMLTCSFAQAQTAAVAGHEETTRKVVRAYFSDIKLARSIAHGKFETLESKYELGYVVVNASPNDMRELRAMGFRLESDATWFQQQDSVARTESAQRNLSTQAKATFAGIPKYTCYPLVEEVFSEANALIAAKPTLASWIDIGDSWEKTKNLGGYDLKADLTQPATLVVVDRLVA